MAKILLVDDESAITDNLAPFLARAGLAVEVAVDGEDALSKAARFAPELIVSDVLMPRVDGREMLRRLRRSGDWTPVILLTQVGERHSCDTPAMSVGAHVPGTRSICHAPTQPSRSEAGTKCWSTIGPILLVPRHTECAMRFGALMRPAFSLSIPTWRGTSQCGGVLCPGDVAMEDG